MESIRDEPGIAADARGDPFGRPLLPRPIARDQDIGGNQRARFGRQHEPHALDRPTCSATIAPTPIAMQTKKKTSRFQADRVSRNAVSRTNRI